MTGSQRAGRRAALLVLAPWLERPDVGPRAVEAGDCSRCGRWPRLLPTCGPVAWTELCRDCAHEVGDDAWCDGHRDEGRRARAWAERLPDDWASIVRAWWVATGELSPGRARQ